MNAQFSFNSRLEVRFDAKPDRQVRTVLKDRGFWWDSQKQCWWLAKPVSLRFVRNEPITTDGWEYALDGLAWVAGLTPEQRAQLTKAYRDHNEARAVEGMLEANGII